MATTGTSFRGLKELRTLVGTKSKPALMHELRFASNVNDDSIGQSMLQCLMRSQSTCRSSTNWLHETRDGAGTVGVDNYFHAGNLDDFVGCVSIAQDVDLLIL